ncbi:MAG: YveK family protein [Turicibacter sp.]
MNNRSRNTNINQLLNMIKKNMIWVICLTMLAGVGAGGINAFIIDPIYSSSTTIFVSYKQNQDLQMTYNDILASHKLMNTYSEVIKSRLVLEQVKSQLNMDVTIEELENMITVEAVKDTEILRITVENKDALLSADIGNTIATIFQNEIKNIMEVESIAVIDIANVPLQASSPNILLNTVITMAVTGMASFSVLFVIEYLNAELKSDAKN